MSRPSRRSRHGWRWSRTLAVDLALDLRDTRRAFSAVAPRVARHDLDPAKDEAIAIGRARSGRMFAKAGGGLERLDLVNVEALAKIADEDPASFRLVLVRGEKGGRIWTTPRRAAEITGTAGQGQRWRLVDDEEV